jgi:hypothetical protein
MTASMRFIMALSIAYQSVLPKGGQPATGRGQVTGFPCLYRTIVLLYLRYGETAEICVRQAEI